MTRPFFQRLTLYLLTLHIIIKRIILYPCVPAFIKGGFIIYPASIIRSIMRDSAYTLDGYHPVHKVKDAPAGGRGVY